MIVLVTRRPDANVSETVEATLREVQSDGVFPDDFYSTTNLETVVRLGGHWVPVENPEMDCGIVVVGERARTIAVSDVKAGDRLVCGPGGVKPVKRRLRTSGCSPSRRPATARSPESTLSTPGPGPPRCPARRPAAWTAATARPS